MYYLLRKGGILYGIKHQEPRLVVKYLEGMPFLLTKLEGQKFFFFGWIMSQ